MSSCRGNKCACECERFQPSRENDAICQECAHGISKHPDKDPPPALPAASALPTTSPLPAAFAAPAVQTLLVTQNSTNAMAVFKSTVARAAQWPHPLARPESNACSEALAMKKTMKPWKFGANPTKVKVSTYISYYCLQLS